MESEAIRKSTKNLSKQQVIQKRLVLALKYLRVLNRLTAKELTGKTGVNINLLEDETRPVSLDILIKLQEVFGSTAIAELICNTWQDDGKWTEKSLEKLILEEEAKWEAEKHRAGDKE